MEFAIVETGYDRAQVDSCLTALDEQLTGLAERIETTTDAGAGMAAVRRDVARLRELLAVGILAGPGRSDRSVVAEQEAAAILARAREELAAAREEARLVRDQVYAEALQARRDFEAALHARRLREERVDELLRAVTVVPAPAGGAESDPASAVPATRAAAVDPAEHAR